MGRIKIGGEILRQRLTVTLPPQLIKDLRTYADKKIMSISALVETYINLGIRKDFTKEIINEAFSEEFKKEIIDYEKLLSDGKNE